MTANKDFKRLVRRRMQKTGESYTAARAQLIRRPVPRPLAPSIAPIAKGEDYARLAGMSDASVKKATGCPWERWVTSLDRVKANEWPHMRIVEYVHEKYKTPDWWSQMVTVGYERIKGLRVHGQRRDGKYNVSKSKVFAVPLGTLYKAFVRALDGVATVRTATKNKSVRATWPDGTYLAVGFYSKGRAKAQVQVQHEKLPDAATA